MGNDQKLDKKIEVFTTHFLLPIWKWVLRAESWPDESLRKDYRLYIAAAFVLSELDQYDFLSTPASRQFFLDSVGQFLRANGQKYNPSKNRYPDNKISDRQLIVEKWCRTRSGKSDLHWQHFLLNYLCTIISVSDPTPSRQSEFRKYDSILNGRRNLQRSWDDWQDAERIWKEVKQLTNLLIEQHAQDLILRYRPQEDLPAPEVPTLDVPTQTLPPALLDVPAPPPPAPEPIPEPAPEPHLTLAGTREHDFAALELERIDCWIQSNQKLVAQAVSEEQGRDRETFIVRHEPLAPGTTVYFVGDLHGDLLSLAAVQTLFEKVPTPKCLVLLGDLVDRGLHSGAVVRAVARMMSLNTPEERVICLRGNHEDAVSWEAGKGYTSSVEPAEYIAELNLNSPEDDWFARFVKTLPVAVYFQEGVFASHGGLPLVDRFPYEKSLLDSREYLQDFVWTRFSEDLPRKRPNRGSKTSEYGFEDIEKMLNQLQERILDGGKIHLYIRGHDHVKERYSVAKKNFARVVTINAMSTPAGEAFGDPHRKPAIISWVVGEDPKVVRLNLPHDLIDRVSGAVEEAAPEGQS